MFRVLKMGKFEGILGMDWLSKNKANIHCGQGILSFQSSEGQRVQVEGRTGRAPLKVVKIARLVKGLRKGLPIYVLKLDKTEVEAKESKPEWLSEFQDLFS